MTTKLKIIIEVHLKPLIRNCFFHYSNRNEEPKPSKNNDRPPPPPPPLSEKKKKEKKGIAWKTCTLPLPRAPTPAGFLISGRTLKGFRDRIRKVR